MEEEKKGRECFERFGMSLQHQSFWIEIMKRERGPERDSGSLIISPRPDEFSTAHTHQRRSSTGASAPVVFTRSRQTDRMEVCWTDKNKEMFRFLDFANDMKHIYNESSQEEAKSVLQFDFTKQSLDIF